MSQLYTVSLGCPGSSSVGKQHKRWGAKAQGITVEQKQRPGHCPNGLGKRIKDEERRPVKPMQWGIRAAASNPREAVTAAKREFQKRGWTIHAQHRSSQKAERTEAFLQRGSSSERGFNGGSGLPQ